MKHALRYNGAAYDADSQLRHEDTTCTSGSGRALCACGALSDVLPTGAARRAWYKEHRAEAVNSDPPGLRDEPETNAAPEPDVVTAELPFAPTAPVSYWRYLGRDGSKVYIGLMHPTVEVLPDSGTRTVQLTGPRQDVQEAQRGLRQLWLDAVDASKAWELTDPEYLARPKGGVEGRMAAYHMKGEFFLRYVQSAVTPA